MPNDWIRQLKTRLLSLANVLPNASATLTGLSPTRMVARNADSSQWLNDGHRISAGIGDIDVWSHLA